MEEKNNKKRKFLILSIIFVLIIGLIGVALARYIYDNGGDTSHEILAGDMYVKFNQGTVISLDSMTPSGEEPANYFQFTVEGKNQSSNSITYNISVLRGALKSGKTESQRIADKFIMFTLQRSTDGENFTDVLTRQSYNDIANGARLYFDTIPANTNNKITYTYRLYAWIGDNVVITGGDANDGDYQDTEWGSMFATIKVRVEGNFAKYGSGNLATLIANNVKQSYIGQYTGSSNDTYNSTGNSPIYYYTGATAQENNNILFAGYCWEIIRTTDTGGVKLLYNGVAEGNKCLTTRNSGGTMKGINGANSQQSISGLDSVGTYGTGFTYTSSGFTLTGVMTNKTWSSDYNDLIGTYTCKGNITTCNTLYYIGAFVGPSSALGTYYTIGTLDDKYTIGKTPFNGLYNSLSQVGYMYNKVYRNNTSSDPKDGTYWSDVTHNGTVYSLKTGGTTSDTIDPTHHYICDTDCSKVRYYYYTGYYITLTGGETIEDALYNQLNYKTDQPNDANLNVHNSAIKAYLESWYSQNLDSYSSYIDTTTTYCNDRYNPTLYGWIKTNAITSNPTMTFKNYTAGKTDLSCASVLDRFSTENSSARISKPIGLITENERALMGAAAGDGVEGKYYWGSSPSGFSYYNAHVRLVSSSGAASATFVSDARGARPVVSLRPDASFSSGDGSYDNPFVVGPTIDRTIS